MRSRNFLYVLRQFGFDPIKTSNSFLYILKYLVSSIKFRKSLRGKKFLYVPSLNDFSSNAGSADGHYFWQDFICSKWIYDASAKEHLDIGSRVDGFITSVLVFCKVTLIDIRPLDIEIEGLSYINADIQSGLPAHAAAFDSVSSLHCIEHFGLGRYNDPLNLNGHEIGLINISKLVSNSGNLYVSFPIGEEAIEFNSQRIIDPLWPERILKNFKLEEFVLIPWKGAPKFGLNPKDVDKQIWGQAGLYKFRRVDSCFFMF
jgi:hypothetical protein